MSFLKQILSFTLFCWCSLSFAAEISLRDKIGQMLIFGFDGKTIDINSPVVKAIDEQNIGGVILFDFDPQTKRFDKNIASPEQVKILNQQLQSANHTANLAHHRKDLPLLISVDYEGGQVTRLKEEYGFPATISAKTMGNMPMKEVDQIAGAMATTLKSSGFNLDFAPVLDVDVNPDNPIIGKRERSFSSNPVDVANMLIYFPNNF